MGHKKGFIFDLDGVVVDTAKYHFLAWKKLANGLGIDFTEAQNEHLKGVSRVASLEKILGWGNKTISSGEFERLLHEKNEDYLNYIKAMTTDEILPGVARVLDMMGSNQHGIALGSASKNARIILEKIDLISKFHHIVDGNDVSKAKPDPEVFIQAANGLGVGIKDCVVFEDSVAGIQAANAAGMLSIGLGAAEVLHEANYVFDTFTSMDTDFLQRLMQSIN